MQADILEQMTDQSSDAELLVRFSQTRDETAFHALVLRHGKVVLGACRRVLGNTPDVEDAAQAAFIVLARKAATLDAREPLAPWLHRVAAQVALDARKAAGRRRRHEEEARRMQPLQQRPEGLHNLEQEFIRNAIDGEINALPRYMRYAFILHHLQGLSQKEIARRMRQPVGTVGSWLYRARELLKKGLARRGAVLSVSALLSIVTSEAQSVELPPGWLESTVSMATGCAHGPLPNAGPNGVQLAKGALQSMQTKARMRLIATVLVAALLSAAAGKKIFEAAAGEEGPAARAAVAGNASGKETIQALIEKLGSNDYAEREEAHKRLAGLWPLPLSEMKKAYEIAESRDIKERLARLIHTRPFAARWEFDNPEGNLAAAPGRVLVKQTGRLVSLDAVTGRVQWSAPIRWDGGNPVIANDRVFIETTYGGNNGTSEISCFDLQRGEQRWTARQEGSIHGLLVAGDYVYAFALSYHRGYETHIVCMNQSDGKTVWMQTIRQECGAIHSMAIHNGRLFIASQGGTFAVLINEKPIDANAKEKFHRLRCYGADSGKLMWQKDLGQFGEECSPLNVVAAGERILVFNAGLTGRSNVNRQGNDMEVEAAGSHLLQCLKATDGSEMWTKPCGECAPVPWSDHVILCSSGTEALDISTGKSLWRTTETFDGKFNYWPSVRGDKLYKVCAPRDTDVSQFGLDGYRRVNKLLVCVDLASRKTEWMMTLPECSNWRNEVVAAGDALFVMVTSEHDSGATRGTKLLCIDAGSKGADVWPTFRGTASRTGGGTTVPAAAP